MYESCLITSEELRRKLGIEKMMEVHCQKKTPVVRTQSWKEDNNWVKQGQQNIIFSDDGGLRAVGGSARGSRHG